MMIGFWYEYDDYDAHSFMGTVIGDRKRDSCSLLKGYFLFEMPRSLL
jgi:hypothetical protein